MVLWSSLVYESKCAEGKIAVMREDTAMEATALKEEESFSTESGPDSIDDLPKSGSVSAVKVKTISPYTC